MRKKMYKIIIKIFILLIIANVSYAQKLRIVRTDTDTSRAGFITAGNLFGIDIYYENINNLNRIVFDIEYNNIRGINYSGWRSNKPSDDGYVYAVALPDSINDRGLIGVVAVAGDPLKNAYFKRNNIIHLDFVVSQNVTHLETIKFEIKNIQAYIWRNDVDSVISFQIDPVIFSVHGYVDVWPGDANDDGIVDLQDIHQITQMLGYGSEKNNSRTFKRQNASTLWYPQKVLAWDNEMATYSDCDGNGSVTIKDMLVVQINITKTHNLLGKINNKSYLSRKSTIEKLHKYLSTLKISPNGDLKAIVGKIDCKNICIEDIEPRLLNDFSELNIWWDKTKDNELVFFISSITGTLRIDEEGNFLNLLFDRYIDGSSFSEIEIKELYALDKFNNIYEINSYLITDLENSDDVCNVYDYHSVNNKYLKNNSENLKSFKIYNYAGYEIYSGNTINDLKTFFEWGFLNLPFNRYFLVLVYPEKYEKVIITNE